MMMGCHILTTYTKHVWATGQGSAGCRNIRRGGDSVDTSSEGEFMTYAVFRSFKYKPVSWSFPNPGMHFA